MANTLLDGNGLSSEFFYIEMKEVDASNGKIWDDGGTGADASVAFWKANPSPGFFALGHFVTNFHDINREEGRQPPVALTLKPKPGFEDLLKEPTGVEKVWDDAGSGGTYGGCYIWRMTCPDGYVALGDIVTDSEQVNKSDFRCIKKTAVNAKGETVSLVSNAKYMNLAGEGQTEPKALWTDSGSGADKDVAIWLMQANGRPSARNQVYLVAGTFKASRYHNIMPSDTPYALLLNFPESDIMEKVVGSKKIKLAGPQLPSEEEMRASEVSNEYFVPFFAVQDSMYPNQLRQFQESPFYKIRRITRYEAIDSYEPINTEEKEYTVTTGKTTESNYSNEVGVTLGVAVEQTIKAGAPTVAEASTKVTVSLEASYSHSWGGSTSEYEEQSFMYKQTVTGGCFGALFQAKSTYTIYRKDGTPVGAPVEVKTRELYTDEWRPESIAPKADSASASGDSAPKAAPTSPNTITFTIEAPPGKTIILEGRLEIRDGQLMSVPTVISTPTVITIPATATTATVTPLAPPAGATMSFDSNTSQMVVNNKLSRSYTKEAWIRLPDSANGGRNIISGGTSFHAFWIDNRIVKSGHNEKWDSVQCSETVGQGWEHYAVTYDADTQEMKLYKNGKLVSSSQNIPKYNGDNFVQIGRWDIATNLFIGEMAEVRIWNSARTEEQIASQMNVAIPKATAGLIARYPAG
jgi:hypothetical protein